MLRITLPEVLSKLQMLKEMVKLYRGLAIVLGYEEKEFMTIKEMMHELVLASR